MLKKIGLLFVCVTSVSAAPIPCPSIDFVRSHAAFVNAVMIVKKNDYAVYTSNSFYEAASHLRWQLGTDAYSKDFNTAYDMGTMKIQQTTQQIDRFAEYLQEFWLCLYGDGNNVTMYLTSKIANDFDITSSHVREHL